jgi:hypothetical protein
MSDAYQHHGVTITPQGGGYYALSHPNLAEPERVRGKETADQRAEEIAAMPPVDDAPMQPQGDLDVAGVAEPAPAVATVAVTEGEAPRPSTVPKAIPRKFDGKLTDEQKKALPVTFTRIILDDNSDIPPTGLYLGHNGRGYVIVPGEEVDVPDFLLGILDDAVMAAPMVDNKTQKVLGYRNRMRYSYRRV